MLNFSKIKCVGCTACASICSQKVISMNKTPEGFQYPFSEKIDSCVECGLCEMVCPVLNLSRETPFEQIGLIAQITDEEIRKESTSGGMFSAIALSVLDENGIVYGAAYNDDFEVCHVGIKCKEDLWKLRHSKYVQSNLVGVFEEIKLYLDDGRKVCFSGTPCQIEGLQSYLRNDYKNLLLVDVVCHGVSSPLIWDRYLEFAKKESIKKIYFRWKHFGYKYSTMSFFDKNNHEVYCEGVETDKMLRAYFSNICDRNTCYECVFKKRYRISDFTIWDFFHPRLFNKSWDDDRGTSGVLVHSEKAKEQFNRIINANYIRYQFVPVEELILGNNEMVSSIKKNELRENFLNDAIFMSGESLFNKYFPDSAITRIKRLIRIALVKLGLYSVIKYRLFLHRRKTSKNVRKI